jgi:hypothetical protein
VATRTIKIKIKQSVETEVNPSGLRGLQQELKKTKSALVDATDPKELEQLSVKAAELKDQIQDLNDEVKSFQGSKFEQVTGQLGKVGGSIKNLDFSKASQQAQTLISISKGITFKEAISGVSNLGKTFLNLGKALLTNPLFLIGAVIAALVLAIVKLSEKLGLLQKVTEAVGKAMDALWQIAKRVLSIIPAFRDAFQTEEMIKDADKRIAAYKKEEAAVGGKYDFEIRKLQAAGLSTEEAERQKRNAILLTLKAQNDALRSLVQTGKATEDQIKVWNENQAKIKALKDDAVIAEIAAEKKAKDEYAKLQAERSKAAIDAAKKAAEEAKKYAEDRRNFERTLRDLEIAAIENDLQRELASNNEKYARLIEDTLRNQNLLETEKEALVLAYEKERERNKQAALDKEFNDTKAKIEEEQQALIDANIRSQQAILEANLINDRANFEKTLANKQALLDFEREQALANKELTEGEKLKIEADYAAKSNDLLEEKAAREKALQQAVVDNALQLSQNALGGLSANLKEGGKAAKGAAVAQTTIDTYVGAQKAWTSQFIAGDPSSIVRGAIAAASAVAFGVANVRKILATNPSKSSSAPSGGGSSAPKPSTGQLTAGAPAFNLFGQGNNLNQTNAAENREQGQTQMTVKAVVSETEITDTQERVSKLRQTAEL